MGRTMTALRGLSSLGSLPALADVPDLRSRQGAFLCTPTLLGGTYSDETRTGLLLHADVHRACPIRSEQSPPSRVVQSFYRPWPTDSLRRWLGFERRPLPCLVTFPLRSI